MQASGRTFSNACFIGRSNTGRPAWSAPPTRQRWFRLRRAAFVLTAASAAACLNDATISPERGAPVAARLAISAVVAGTAGQFVEISVFYTRTTGEQRLLPSNPTQVTFGGTTIDVPVTVDLGPCLNDAQRIGASNAGCRLSVKLRLLDAQRAPLDSNTTPASASAPGETIHITPPPLTSISRYTVDVRASTTNAGPGRVSGNGIDCVINGASTSGTCSVQLSHGSIVSLAGQGTSGNALSAWSGPCSGNAGCNFSLSGNTTVTASFTAPTGLLTVQPAAGNQGSGRVTGNGIDCNIAGTATSGTCSAPVARGAQVTLAAQGTNGSALIGWGGPCSGTGTCNFVINGDAVVTAGFTPPNLTLSVQAGAGNAGPGRVTGTGIDCSISATSALSGTCSVPVAPNTQVSLSATGTNGNRLNAWGGPCSGSAGCAFTMTANTTVTAAFTASVLTLTVQPAAGNLGSGQVNGNGIACTITAASTSGTCVVQVTAGTAISLGATSNSGFAFGGWGGGSCSGVAACNFTINDNTTVTAAFSQSAVLSVGPDPGSVGIIGGTVAGNAGSGTVTGNGINCTITGTAATGVCSVPIAAGTQVSLTANGTGGWAFGIWSGSCSGSNACSFTMPTTSANVNVRFLPMIVVEPSAGNTGSGTVTGTPSINCTISGTSKSGTCAGVLTGSVSLSALATGGSTFVGWGGPCTGTGACSFFTVVSLITTPTVTVTAGFSSATANIVWSTVEAGSNHTCGLAIGGRAYCWGANAFGETGDGTTSPRFTVNEVQGGLAFAKLAAGVNHSCGLTSNGQAYCWGANGDGEIGDGTTSMRLTPSPAQGGLSFATLTGNGWSTCGVTTGGRAYCWGDNTYAQVGDGTTSDRLTPTAVQGGLTFATLGGGPYHTCGVATGGQAYCWGFNAYGQLGDGTTVNRSTPAAVQGGLSFTTVAGGGGGGYTCGITTLARAYCWGSNSYGQLGDGTTSDRLTPAAVQGSLSFVALTAGSEHTCGLAFAGRAYCWGSNSFGELGDGTTSGRLTPTVVQGGLTFATITAGDHHTCGVTTGGQAYCWGYNVYRQLGDGTSSNRLIPTLVANPSASGTVVPLRSKSLAPP